MIELIHGDCMEYLKDCKDKRFNLAIVDPPYGIKRLHSGGMPESQRFIKWERKEWDNSLPSKMFFKAILNATNNQIIWGGNYFTEYLHSSQGWIFWFKQQGMTFADGELAWTSFDKATRQYDMSGMGAGAGADADKIHPTQKSIKLYRWLLQNYAKPGDTILDTHGGSMSIAIACYIEGFDLVCIEKDKDYFDAAKKRFDNYVLGNPRLFEPEELRAEPKQAELF